MPARSPGISLAPAAERAAQSGTRAPGPTDLWSRERDLRRELLRRLKKLRDDLDGAFDEVMSAAAAKRRAHTPARVARLPQRPPHRSKH